LQLVNDENQITELLAKTSQLAIVEIREEKYEKI